MLQIFLNKNENKPYNMRVGSTHHGKV